MTTTTHQHATSGRQRRWSLPAVLHPSQRQRIFRACLEALARPGTRHDLSIGITPAPDTEPGLPAQAAPILVLADLMTPLAAADAYARDDLERLCALTHAPRGRLTEARFVLAGEPVIPEVWPRLCRGSQLRPHQGALVCMPARFDDGRRMRLVGPGVDGEAELSVEGLHPDFVAARAEVVAGFPRGVDCLLVDPMGQVVGLPRTTMIEELG